MENINSHYINLSELIPIISPLEIIGLHQAMQERRIRYVTCLPENASPEGLYVCMNEFLRYGQWVEGVHLLPEALSRKPAALVIERPVAGVDLPQLITAYPAQALARTAQYINHYPDKRLHIIGVTGTNGKTTTTHLIRHLLTQTGHSGYCMGTIGVFGDSGKLFDSVYTTPLAHELFHTMSAIAAQGASHLAMEISSHALKLERVFGLNIQTAVLTNITRDHLDFHQTLEDYIQSKQRLFAMLDAGGTAVINRDDPFSPIMADAVSGRIIGYSIDKPSDLQAVDIKYTPTATRFKIRWQGGMIPVTTRLTGRFNVYNALAAASALLAQNMELEQAVEFLPVFAGVPGRMQVVPLAQNRVGIVDYAHTPDALENVLRTLRETASGRIITVFGCGGDRDRGKRPLMGQIAQQWSDLCIVTSDNPRTENPDQIIHDILTGMNRACIYIEPDRRQAIQKAYRLSREHDIILLAGKGHEDYQIIGVTKTHFSDVEELNCLAQL